MSAAAATTPTVADAVPPAAPGGKKKKLILIGAIVALVLVLAAAGGGTMLWMKSKAAHAAAEADDDDATTGAAAKGAHADPAHAPTFLPLDMFVVNLADKDTDRYAQIGIVLEVDTPAFAEQMRAYMPAIRNAILMILAHKTSREMLEREGKEQLAAEIMRETVRPMGIDIPAPVPVAASASEAAAASDDEVEKKPAPRKKAPHNPVRHVHFSNFIIQ